MQSILLGTDDAAGDSADELESTAAAIGGGGGLLELLEVSAERPQRAQAVMFTAREEDDGLAVGGRGGDDNDDMAGEGEIEGDEIGDFSD